MRIIKTSLCLVALVSAVMMLAACGGGSDDAADKVAAAYYEEELNKHDLELRLLGPVKKWETEMNSRKKSVEGKIMMMTIGFYHEQEDAPQGRYFVMQNDGKEWTVRSMTKSTFYPKEKYEEMTKDVKQADKPEPQFGPQEQAALDAWKEKIAGRRDFLGKEITDPDLVAKNAEIYRESYGEYIDCFVEEGSEKWTSEDGGQVRLKVCHEKKDDQFAVRVQRQPDGSWAASY